jgi:uncharacterized protein
MPGSQKRPKRALALDRASIAQRETPLSTFPSQPPRLAAIDVVRGLALLGIVLVNIAAFRLGVFATPGGGGLGAGGGWRNGIADTLVLWLATGKFILIFSFLFGWGIHTQAGREGNFRARYLRRLLGLALIGLAHAALFFSGDILVLYAILGLFMLRPVARDWPVRKLVRRALILFGVQAAIMLLLLAGPLLLPADPGDDWLAEYAKQSLEIYRGGSFAAITARRLADFAMLLPLTLLFAGWGLLAMFHLGLAAAKAFAASGLDAACELAWRVLRLALLPGLAGNGLCAVVAIAAPEPWATAVGQAQFALFAPLLSLSYLAAAALLLQGRLLETLAATVGAAGRMSLSVYVGQSAVLSLVFYGYGLGLAGSMGSAAGLLVCVAVYAALVAFAMWWLARFRIGPLEWVLRSITEARPVPLRRALPAAGGSVPAVAPSDRGGGA